MYTYTTIHTKINLAIIASFVHSYCMSLVNKILYNVSIILECNVPFEDGKSAAVGTSTLPATVPYPPPAAADPYPPLSPPGGSFNYSTAYPPVNIGFDNYTRGRHNMLQCMVLQLTTGLLHLHLMLKQLLK